MAVEYPDILNDVTDARKRFESGVVQFIAVFSPGRTPPGSIAPLQVSLQNVMDVPAQVAVRLGLPELKGKARKLPQPPFQLLQPEINVKLEGAEVVQLNVPVYVSTQAPLDTYAFSVGIRSAVTAATASDTVGTRVRSTQGQNRLGDLKIRHPQGLGITQITPWGFQSQEAQRQMAPLAVIEGGATEGAPDKAKLQPGLNSLWMVEDWDIIPPARREVNERRIHIMPELTAGALYLPLMKQSQALFAACGVRLHLGEAIFLTKMLTHTVLYMASKAEWFDCLMVPIYAFAQANQDPTDDPVWLVTELGYSHVLELAIALGFSLAEEVLQRELWDADEQRGVRSFIVQSLETGGDLPTEFVYLPLLLGGMLVANEVVMEGEDVRHSLALLAKAKAGKAELFVDPDLRTINAAFDHIMARMHK